MPRKTCLILDFAERSQTCAEAKVSANASRDKKNLFLLTSPPFSAARLIQASLSFPSVSKKSIFDVEKRRERLSGLFFCASRRYGAKVSISCPYFRKNAPYFSCDFSTFSALRATALKILRAVTGSLSVIWQKQLALLAHFSYLSLKTQKCSIFTGNGRCRVTTDRAF